MKNEPSDSLLATNFRLGDIFVFIYKVKLDKIVLFTPLLNGSGRQRLLREKHELKAPQERSDEEIEAVPAESVCLERKTTVYKRKMRVWERNRSHTRIDVPIELFQCPQTGCCSAVVAV